MACFYHKSIQHRVSGRGNHGFPHYAPVVAVKFIYLNVIDVALCAHELKSGTAVVRRIFVLSHRQRIPVHRRNCGLPRQYDAANARPVVSTTVRGSPSRHRTAAAV